MVRSFGSYLAYIYPGDYQRKKRGEHLLVRVIEYSIDDENRPEYGERHRLITSLLEPDDSARAIAPFISTVTQRYRATSFAGA